MIVFIFGKNPIEVEKEVKKHKQNNYKNFYGTIKELQVQLNTNKNLFQEKLTDIVIPLDINKNIVLDKNLADFLKTLRVNEKNLIIYSTEKDLQTFAKKFKLTKIVEIFKVKEQPDREIFKFIDAAFAGKLEEALIIMSSQLKGFSAGYLISMLFNSTKNLLYFYYDPEAFSKLHPYVQQKTKALSQKMSKKTVYNVIMVLKEGDYKLKSSTEQQSILAITLLYIKNNIRM